MTKGQTNTQGPINKNSAPSALNITDMRACRAAANYDYPIIKIDTNPARLRAGARSPDLVEHFDLARRIVERTRAADRGRAVHERSGAACSSGGTKVYVMGRGIDRAVWYNVSSDNGADWNPHWAPVPDGTLTSSPAVHVAPDGVELTLLGLSGDFCPWSIRSIDGGAHWSSRQQVGSEYYL